jgi:hypothetical protein
LEVATSKAVLISSAGSLLHSAKFFPWFHPEFPKDSWYAVSVPNLPIHLLRD